MTIGWSPDFVAMPAKLPTYAEALSGLKRACRHDRDYLMRDAVIDEVARLKALLFAAEFADDGQCPWCHYVPKPHANDCPAFTPEGVVR